MLVPGKPFQPNIIFASKHGAYLIEVLQGRGSGVTHKHSTRLEKLAKDKHSNLLLKFVNHGQNFFIALAPGPLS